MLVFAAITIVSADLLCDCYRSPDPEYGPTRSKSYVEAVKLYLGENNKRISGLFLQESLYGCGVAYVITSAASVRAIQKSNCYHKEGHKASCEYGDTVYMVLFGVVQIVASQIPDCIWHGSLLLQQSCPSFTLPLALYLALQLSLDTLKSPPPENRTMKKASMSAIFITTFFYLCCGCFGYAAFGDKTPGNLLSGFGFYEPFWLIDFANACIILHLVGGYQSFTCFLHYGVSSCIDVVVVGIGLAGDGVIKGNIARVSTATTLEKLWLVSQALGDIAFAYPYSIILVEIRKPLSIFNFPSLH
ncbi:putative amino acid permease 7 [Camellia lanceoleosa]|uniref:Amino acid permease 7 n=1 Tax=Camellia lanceoleosa TaxID=1840588 RepID=A0ACC0HGK4_9ERIC|nr:putative amino acid permease 7 [Camellia lanceoleosa]